MKLKKQIQNLIDFQSPRIALKEIPTNDFSKNIRISQNFQLITLDGEPVPELMLCKKCFQVRARGQLTSTPIVPHLKNHEKVEMTRKNEQKKKSYKNNNATHYASSLYQAMKDSVPISLVTQEYGNDLSRAQRIAIEKTILSQGEPEAQITLCKNLKSIVWKKINLENSEQKKRELYQELKDLASMASTVEYHTIEKTPQLNNRLSSQISFSQTENTQSTKSQEKVMSIPIPEVNNTDSSVAVPLEVQQAAGTGSISIAPGENEESTNSSSVISENNIKLEINND